MKKPRLTQKIEDTIAELLSLTENYSKKPVAIHDMEKGLLSCLLQLGLMLLRFIVSEQAKSLLGFKPEKLSEQEELSLKDDASSRTYISLFGGFSFTRPRHYSSDRGSYHELDARLSIPIGSQLSYNLQELLGEGASENDFRESTRLLNKLLNLNLSGESSRQNVDNLGETVANFYDTQVLNPELGVVYYSVSFDGKGVPKIKASLDQLIGNPKKRLEKGQKKDKKEMATVVVTSKFTPKERTKESIIKSLIGSPLSKLTVPTPSIEPIAEIAVNDNRWHEEIHRRAFLADQATAIEYGLDRIRLNLTNPLSRFVVPIDAGIGLESKVMAYVDKYELHAQFDGIILDIIHVSEYLWDAGTAIFGEKSALRLPWVKENLELLLDSETTKVIADLQVIIDTKDLSESKQKAVNKAILYFSNHQHKMDYKMYLQKGYPVSSALVESACGHLIKERMEQSGMRWSSKGAQNIMDVRAVKLNGEIEPFMKFFIQKQQQNRIKSAA